MDVSSSSVSIYSNPPKIQKFSFPENIIFYISKKNPSIVKVYEKLIKICKYFYLKNPIITFDSLTLCLHSRFWVSDRVNGIPYFKRLPDVCNSNKKLWIYGLIKIYELHDSFAASALASKIYRCDITYLTLGFQILTFADFKILSPSNSLKFVYFNKVLVKNCNDKYGRIIPIEKLIENLPNLEEIYFDNVDEEENGLRTITSETAGNLIAIPHFDNIKSFKLLNIPEGFGFETFFNGLKKPSKMDVNFWFGRFLSNDYKQRLQTFVNNLIHFGVTEDHPFPFIDFPEMQNDFIFLEFRLASVKKFQREIA